MKTIVLYLLPCAAIFAQTGRTDWGQGVFDRNCLVCHSGKPKRTPSTQSQNPDPVQRAAENWAILAAENQIIGRTAFTGLYNRNLKSGVPATDETVGAIIDAGSPQKGMPPSRDALSAQQRADLLAYLKSL